MRTHTPPHEHQTDVRAKSNAARQTARTQKQTSRKKTKRGTISTTAAAFRAQRNTSRKHPIQTEQAVSLLGLERLHLQCARARGAEAGNMCTECWLRTARRPQESGI